MSFAIIVVGKHVPATSVILNKFRDLGLTAIIVTDQKSHFELSSYWQQFSEVVELDETGIGNRNIQRLQMNIALKRAQDLGFRYALKWRADLYPQKINLGYFRQLIAANCTKIHIQNYRIRKSTPDVCSSLPDLYMFGSLESLKDAWHIDYYNYDLPTNILNIFIESKEQGELIINNNQSLDIWVTENIDNHLEIYSTFRENRQLRFNRKICFDDLFEHHIDLICRSKLNYLWLSSNSGFRNRFPAREHKWIREKRHNYKAVVHPHRPNIKYIMKKYYHILKNVDIFVQKFYWVLK